MSKKKRVPELRFRGGEDEWESFTLGDLGKTQSGIGFPENEQGRSEGIPFFKVSDMNIQGNENEMYFANNYVSTEQIARRNWKPIVQVPAVIFAKVGAALLLNRKRLVRFHFLIDNNSMAYIFGTLWDINFGKALFDTIQLSQYAQIGTLPSYNGPDIEGIPVNITLNKEEQAKIGRLFQSLDTLISLHQRKYEKLLVAKKAMREKMFPKKGSELPEIRFRGFVGKWSERRWENTVNISTKMVDPKNYQYATLPHVGPGNIESFTGRMLNNVKTVEESNLISGKFYFKKGDIIYGKINPQLAKYIIAPCEGLTSADAYVLNAKNGLAQDFLFNILQTEAFYNYSVSVSKRTGMPKINREELNLYSFLAPASIDEQLKISAYFKHLDSYITLQLLVLTKLKHIKKACLEKMFV